MSRRALITGATGFVGTHLVEHLARAGWSISALVRPTSDTAALDRIGARKIVGGLNHPDSLAEAVRGADVVFHLAAVTFGRSEDEYRRANVEGTQLLADAIVRTQGGPGRVVYLSSYAACGPAPRGGVRRADESPAPLTAYGRTKLEAEQVLARTLGNGAELVTLRAPAVYGPGDRALLPYFRLVRWGLAPAPAGGGERLHMVYGPDLGRAVARAAGGPAGMYAVSDGVVHRWGEIVGAISAALGRRRRPLPVPIPRLAVRGAAAVTERIAGLMGRAATFNREKAEEMLAEGWVCDTRGSERLLSPAEATPIEEGMVNTVRWYRSHGWL